MQCWSTLGLVGGFKYFRIESTVIAMMVMMVMMVMVVLLLVMMQEAL